MSSTYHHDYRAFGRIVLNGPEMVAIMLARAERVKAFAEAIAPYDPTDLDGDHYRDHFSVSAGTHGGIHNDRAYGRVTNDHPAALYIEFGTSDTPRHRTLGKALDAAG